MTWEVSFCAIFFAKSVNSAQFRVAALKFWAKFRNPGGIVKC